MNTVLSSSVPDVFQIGWVRSTDCSTPPNVMYSFSGITTTLYNETINEQVTLTTCGSNLFPMNGGCCLSNLDSTTYFSGYSSLVQRQAFTDKSNFPVAANGANYCHVKALNNGSLYGLSDIWYFADSTCIDDHFSCKPNGEFHYYPNSQCTGTSSSIQLNTKEANFNFQTMGGSEKYTWTTYVPSVMLIFKYQVPMEIAAAVCYLTAFGISLAVLAYSINKYLKTRSMYLTVVVISQTLWVIWIAMDFAYLNIAFPVTAANLDEKYAEIEACIFNMASLTTVLNTANFIVGFRNITSPVFKYGIYGFIMVMHIALAGGNYFTYWYLTMGEGTIWQSWHQILPLWTLVMFIFNTVPSFTIAIPLVKNSEYLRNMSTATAIRKLLVTDLIFSGLVFLQLLNTICVIVFYYIQQFTQVLGSDRNYYSMNGVFALNYSVHAVINSMFIEHIRSVLKSGKAYSSKSHNMMVFSANTYKEDSKIGPELNLVNKV
ncbi:hypothetical protein HDV04_001597 [Boothiomyces sp. JEL0838]|nr:hypothetical protein HDV04_001597 [Boothiomyces sp. JEL0838]